MVRTALILNDIDCHKNVPNSSSVWKKCRATLARNVRLGLSAQCDAVKALLLRNRSIPRITAEIIKASIETRTQL